MIEFLHGFLWGLGFCAAVYVLILVWPRPRHKRDEDAARERMHAQMDLGNQLRQERNDALIGIHSELIRMRCEQEKMAPQPTPMPAMPSPPFHITADDEP